MLGGINEKKIIVAADDDVMTLTTLELYLKNEYEVHTVSSGDELLEYLTNSGAAPDLILLDIVMPGMDGWETFKKIKAISRLKNVPVVFATALDDGETKKRAKKIGISGYITKPYNMTFLQSFVKIL
jgi:putative two-component system response regulator